MTRSGPYDPALQDERERALRLAAAEAVATEAAALAMKLRPPPGGPQGGTKGVQDYVTEADGAVEQLLAERLGALFPDDGFLGEENGRRPDEARHSGYVWVVDPIDGTSNYARGRERWCISIGLMHHDEPVAGVVNAPALGEIYTGRRGHGAFLNGRPLAASPVTDPTTAIVEMGWSPKVTRQTYTGKIDAFMALGVMPRTCGSGTLALCDVASGRQDAYLEMVINLWDVAAALVFLGEAGAIASPFLRDGGLTGGALLFAAAPGVARPLADAAGIALD